MSRHFPTWQEATAGCLWIIAATGLAWSGPKLPLLESVILWTVLLLGVTIVLRRFWSWLFGPLFFYDLVRTARRNRLIPARCSFAIAMLAVVFFFYLDWFHLPLTSWEQLFSTPSVTRNQVASFGSTMFSWFFGMQYVAVLLLTPVYTAGAIAEEKERRTLDLLLTTHLTNREIVLGLLASRLATLGLIFLTSLPILSLMELLGGIDPQLVLAGFVMTGMAMTSAGSLSILVSVHAKNTTRAIFERFIYMGLLGACWILGPVGAIRNAGNPSAVTTIAGVLVVAYGYVSVALLFWAVLRIRKVVQGSEPLPIPQVTFPQPEDKKLERRPRLREIQSRPSSAFETARSTVTDSPILWKDYTSQGTPIPWAIYLVFCCLLFLCCSGVSVRTSFRSDANSVLKSMTPLALLFLVFPVGILSSRMIAKEREAQTLELLLTTSLEPKEILKAKWLASILRIRWLFLVVVGAFLLGALDGAIHPAAFIWLVAATIIYVGFFACLGLFISMHCDTSLKAMVVFIVTFLAFGIGAAFQLVPMSNGPEQFPRAVLRLVYYALSPLSTIRELTFNADQGTSNTGDVVASFGALILVALATWLLWKWTVFSFEGSTGGRLRRSHLDAN
jgi:ABC-type transport system involved in multi-copper enzyme maturation permease subunit